MLIYCTSAGHSIAGLALVMEIMLIKEKKISGVEDNSLESLVEIYIPKAGIMMPFLILDMLWFNFFFFGLKFFKPV